MSLACLQTSTSGLIISIQFQLLTMTLPANSLACCLLHNKWEPCRIRVVLPNNRYVVYFFDKKAEAIREESALRPFNKSQTQSQGVNMGRGGRRSIEIHPPWAINSDEDDSESFELSKADKLRLKKERKERAQLFTAPRTPQRDENGLNICSELRILLQKLGDQVSQSWTSSQEVIVQGEVLRLKALLNLSCPLNIQDILKEWIVDAMIVLLKEIKQWKINKYPELQKMLENKFNQIKEFVLSEDFEEVNIPEFKKRKLVLKIKNNRVCL